MSYNENLPQFNPRKPARQSRLENSNSYQYIRNIARFMDDYYIDPLIGFFLPAFGDFLSNIFVLPYLYISLFKVRSLPLTLSVTANFLIDTAVGLFPFLGDIFDVFHKGYKRSSDQIHGFVSGDPVVIRKVNENALWMGVLIVAMIFAIYLLIQFADWLFGAIGGLFSCS